MSSNVIVNGRYVLRLVNKRQAVVLEFSMQGKIIEEHKFLLGWSDPPFSQMYCNFQGDKLLVRVSNLTDTHKPKQ